MSLIDVVLKLNAKGYIVSFNTKDYEHWITIEHDQIDVVKEFNTIKELINYLNSLG